MNRGGLLTGTGSRAGILYDGERLLELYNQALRRMTGRGSRMLHLVLTNQLFGTWSLMISLSCPHQHLRHAFHYFNSRLVEAPAKSGSIILTQKWEFPPTMLETTVQGQFLVSLMPTDHTVIREYICSACCII